MKLKLVLLLLLVTAALLPAWDIAPLQLPMLIPVNGYISETGFPIAIRDLDFNFFPYAGISTTLLVYNIQGLGVTGLPSDKPIIGPSYTLLGNLCLKLMLPIHSFQITAKGGGFAFYNLSPFLMKGNLDEAVAKDKGWDTASTDMEFENNIGFGWVVGGSITYYIIQELAGVFLEVLYYQGSAPLKLKGRATGTVGTTVVTDNELSYPDTSINFSAVEITLGITLSL